MQKLCTRWQKKFGEEIDQDLLYLISVDRILHMEDFNEVEHTLLFNFFSLFKLFFCFSYHKQVKLRGLILVLLLE